MLFKEKTFDEHGNEVTPVRERETESEREDRENREARIAEMKRESDERAAAAIAHAERSARERARFIPADAARRTQRATDALARTQGALDKARASVGEAEAACIEEPDARSLDKARAARRVLDDATRDHELANAHAAKVAGEIAAAERASISAEIERLEATRGEHGVIDGHVRELAVEIGLLTARLATLLKDRRAARFNAQPAIDELLRWVGRPTPCFEDDAPAVLGELIALVVAAGAPFSLEASAEFFMHAARANVASAVQTHGAEAAEIAERVTARWSAREKGTGIVSKAAALFGIGALALTLAQG